MNIDRLLACVQCASVCILLKCIYKKMIVQVDNYRGSAGDVDAPIQASVESDPVGRFADGE